MSFRTTVLASLLLLLLRAVVAYAMRPIHPPQVNFLISFDYFIAAHYGAGVLPILHARNETAKAK
jgi:hypothetical protein